MAREYKVPVKKPKVELPICQECLDFKKNKGDYFWVEKDHPIEHSFLCCGDCVKKYKYKIFKPYHESKRKKKES